MKRTTSGSRTLAWPHYKWETVSWRRAVGEYCRFVCSCVSPFLYGYTYACWYVSTKCVCVFMCMCVYACVCLSTMCVLCGYDVDVWRCNSVCSNVFRSPHYACPEVIRVSYISATCNSWISMCHMCVYLYHVCVCVCVERGMCILSIDIEWMSVTTKCISSHL